MGSGGWSVSVHSGSWATFGVDDNGDGIADPHNVFDGVPAMIAHLCPAGSVIDVEAAIFSYNHSDCYVAAVLEWAATYTGALASTGGVVAGYSLPLPAQHLTLEAASRLHHDYPAADVAVPPGTPIYEPRL